MNYFRFLPTNSLFVGDDIEESRINSRKTVQVRLMKQKSEVSKEEDLSYIQPCQLYSRQYHLCTSTAGRTHQYFVEGKYADCREWKNVFGACVRAKEDQKASAQVIEFEKKLRQQRQLSLLRNDIWSLRSVPKLPATSHD